MIRLGICEDVYEEMIYCKKLVDGKTLQKCKCV